MDGDTIDPINPLNLPFKRIDAPSGGADAEPRFELDPEVIPNVEDFVIEDGKPVESIFAEKQYRLLTEPLYSSWTEAGGPFLALSDVGLFYAVHKPPLVPDVMLSLHVPVDTDLSRRENRSYFLWIVGKPPDVVIEFVSDRRGGEEDYKMEEYAAIGVRYYVIFDPENRLRNGVLRVFNLGDEKYGPIEASWLPRVGLGLRLWESAFEGKAACWLRWCDRDGVFIPTGHERAEQERQRAEQERQRAERLAAQLRDLGIEPGS